MGMNYVDQLQRGLSRNIRRNDNGIVDLIERAPNNTLQMAFMWANTEEGFHVWNCRCRISALFLGDDIINCDSLPIGALSLTDEPLLNGMTPNESDDEEIIPLF